VEANFKSYNRNILGIIQTLYHNKAGFLSSSYRYMFATVTAGAGPGI
jgi:hypothetical protein